MYPISALGSVSALALQLAILAASDRAYAQSTLPQVDSRRTGPEQPGQLAADVLYPALP
jgi:hypothetical protein